MKIAKIDVPRGKRLTTHLPLAELADGNIVTLPIILINGVKPGPTLYVGGGIHGDEYTGVRIVTDFARKVPPDELKGSIIAVPVQNPLSFQAGHRFPLSQFLRSPLDLTPSDAWTCFPGDPAGNTIQRIAHALYELMTEADVCIDVHTPTTGGRYPVFTFLPPTTLPQTSRSEELARAFGPDYILLYDQGMYVQPGNPHVVAAKRGKPAFGVELGEGGRMEPDMVLRGVQGLLNVARKLRMLGGRLQPQRRAILIRDLVMLRATKGGFLEKHKGLGETVKKGEVVASIVNVFGETEERVRAPTEGVLLRETTFPTVCSGERVATLGLLRNPIR